MLKEYEKMKAEYDRGYENGRNTAWSLAAFLVTTFSFFGPQVVKGIDSLVNYQTVSTENGKFIYDGTAKTDTMSGVLTRQKPNSINGTLIDVSTITKLPQGMFLIRAIDSNSLDEAVDFLKAKCDISKEIAIEFPDGHSERLLIGDETCSLK